MRTTARRLSAPSVGKVGKSACGYFAARTGSACVRMFMDVPPTMRRSTPTNGKATVKLNETERPSVTETENGHGMMMGTAYARYM